MSILMDYTPREETEFNVEPGHYRFVISRVGEPTTEESRFFKPEPWVDKDGKQHKADPEYKRMRTTVKLECTPIADVAGPFDEEESAIFVFFDLYPRGKSFNPSEKLVAIMNACGEKPADLADLEGKLFWGTYARVPQRTNPDKTTNVITPTDPPKRRAARQEPPQAAPERDPGGRYTDDGSFVYQPIDVDDPQPTLSPIEQSVIAEIQKADDDDHLELLSKRAHRTGTLTDAVQNAIDRKAYAFSLTN